MSEADPIFDPDELGIFDEADPEQEARALAEADADIAAGRVIPHEEVAAWLRTWGTPDAHPAPRHWFE